ncbi:MAG TPA: class I SAM-dependent methyltransferase [Vicinamibacterales bacterium]|nr:class I SAM-dependent methyltransferase [Vicinamibacterales bacterium]
MTSETLLEQFDHIDIYLFDQLLRGRISKGMKVLDAGCGTGRNLVYMLRQGFDLWATDRDPAAVAAARALAAHHFPRLSPDRFGVELVERLPFPDHAMDAVISNAVLHFARDDQHFDAMVSEMWRVLRPGGLFFCRLASSIGMPDRMRPLGHGRFLMPDGSERYVVDEARLMNTTARLGGKQLDPLKTTVVQDQRCMTTWVLTRQ